jgi:hypothetical protein
MWLLSRKYLEQSQDQACHHKEKLRGMPSRECRYSESEYICNENKPLRKVLLDKMGIEIVEDSLV